jgi:hypothetical protein
VTSTVSFLRRNLLVEFVIKYHVITVIVIFMILEIYNLDVYHKNLICRKNFCFYGLYGTLTFIFYIILMGSFRESIKAANYK